MDRWIDVRKLELPLHFGIWGQGAHGEEEKGNCTEHQSTVNVLSQLLTLPCAYRCERNKLPILLSLCSLCSLTRGT